MLSVLLATVGAAMSLKKFENSFDNSHQKLGLALYGAILVQGLIGFFRPHRFINSSMLSLSFTNLLINPNHTTNFVHY